MNNTRSDFRITVFGSSYKESYKHRWIFKYCACLSILGIGLVTYLLLLWKLVVYISVLDFEVMNSQEELQYISINIIQEITCEQWNF